MTILDDGTDDDDDDDDRHVCLATLRHKVSLCDADDNLEKKRPIGILLSM